MPRRRRARQVGRADWRPALGRASSRFRTEACRGPGTVLYCVERVERAPQVDELSAWRSRGILRGHVPALGGDAPTHAPRARTGAQMSGCTRARSHTCTRTAHCQPVQVASFFSGRCSPPGFAMWWMPTGLASHPRPTTTASAGPSLISEGVKWRAGSYFADFLSTAAVWCVPFCLDCSVPSVFQ